MFAADIVAILEPSGSGELRTLGVIGLPEDMVERPFSGIEGGSAAAAIRDRTPVLVENALGDPSLDPQLAELGVQTAAWLPVVGSQQVLGVALLARCRSVPFARSDIDMLMAMANRIGLIIERDQAEEVRTAPGVQAAPGRESGESGPDGGSHRAPLQQQAHRD